MHNDSDHPNATNLPVPLGHGHAGDTSLAGVLNTPPPISSKPASDAARLPLSVEAKSDLLRQIVTTSLGPLSRLSATMDVTLDQVSEWIARPESRRQVFNLLGLLNAQTEMLIAQQRVMAAVRLSEIANDRNASPETVRRACKDLLCMRLIERSRPKGKSGGDDLEPLPLPRPPMSHNEILRTLEQMG